jgi:hypothetical protein
VSESQRASKQASKRGEEEGKEKEQDVRSVFLVCAIKDRES